LELMAAMKLKDILFSPLPEGASIPESALRRPGSSREAFFAPSREDATPKQDSAMQRGSWNGAVGLGGSRQVQGAPREPLNMLYRGEGSLEELGWEGSEDRAVEGEDDEEDPPWTNRPLQVK
jgi:hypothetical protein